MTLQQLRYIVAIDDHRHFGKAAEACGLTQSTLSLMVKKLEEELKYAEGFLASVMKKLGNEKFVNGAPEKVVAVERQKKADAEQKIAALKAQIENLKA